MKFDPRSKFRKSKTLISWTNFWSRRQYTNKIFRSKLDIFFERASLLSTLVGVAGLVSNFYMGLTPFKYLGAVFTLIGVFGFIRSYLKATRSALGGARPQENYELTKDAFFPLSGNSKPVATAAKHDYTIYSFPPDGHEAGHYIYISVSSGNRMSKVAYDTHLENWVAKTKKPIELDKTHPLKDMEKQIIGNDPAYKQNLQLALNVESATSTHEKKNFFNGPKIRFSDIQYDDGKCVVTCDLTSYFTSALTNDLFIKILRKKPAYPSERPIDFRNNFPAIFSSAKSSSFFEIKEFRECARVSNHIGCVVLAITEDRRLVLCRQSNASRINRGRLVASGSGSLELRDFDYVAEKLNFKQTFTDFVTFGMARELLEETGIIPQNDVDDQHMLQIFDTRKRIRLVSYYRDLERSGLPIFVGFAKMDQSFRELQKIQDSKIKSMETDLVDTSHVITNSVDDIEKFLQSYSQENVNNNVRVSGQLLLFSEFLKRPNVKRLFDEVISMV